MFSLLVPFSAAIFTSSVDHEGCVNVHVDLDTSSNKWHVTPWGSCSSQPSGCQKTRELQCQSKKGTPLPPHLCPFRDDMHTTELCPKKVCCSAFSAFWDQDHVQEMCLCAKWGQLYKKDHLKDWSDFKSDMEKKDNIPTHVIPDVQGDGDSNFVLISSKRCVELCLLQHQWASENGRRRCTVAVFNPKDEYDGSNGKCWLRSTDTPLHDMDVGTKKLMSVDVVCMHKMKKKADFVEDLFEDFSELEYNVQG